MFSASILALALFALFTNTASAAPTRLDTTTLRQNAQTAQSLNNLFPSLNPTDACTNDTKACVDGVPALCQNGTWALSSSVCPDTQTCFALPSLRSAGTVLACTSAANAQSVIAAAAGSSNSSASPSPSGSASGSTTSVPVPASTASAFSSASAAAEPNTVTVTVTLASVAVPATTATLVPSAASALLSSLAADPNVHIQTIQAPLAPTVTAAVAPTGSPYGMRRR